VFCYYTIQVDMFDPNGNTYGAAKLLAIQTMGVGYLEKASHERCLFK